MEQFETESESERVRGYVGTTKLRAVGLERGVVQIGLQA
jgi:hypothetical protein